MPVRIRLSRGGAKKRPFYRIVIADSRRSRDGKFIEQIGSYNPMLDRNNPQRVKIDENKAKDWINKGAQPSDRVKIFLSKIGLVEKPIITEKTKKHLPKKKAEDKTPENKQAKTEAPKTEAKTKTIKAETKKKNQKEKKLKKKKINILLIKIKLKSKL